MACPFLDGERRERQSGRAFEIAGHQKSARRQAGKMIFIGAAGPQISGEKLGLAARLLFIGGAARIDVGGKPAPLHRKRRPGGAGRGDEGFARPLREGFRQKRQIEKPLARIIDNVDSK